VIPPENEFLKLLENSQVGLQMKEEEEEAALDEETLEAEISKSALVNLVEGCPGGGRTAGSERYSHPCERGEPD
jgi:hypothetical protein